MLHEPEWLLVARNEMAQRHHLMKSWIRHCQAHCTLSYGFVHELRHAPIITPSAQISVSLFSIILDLIVN